MDIRLEKAAKVAVKDCMNITDDESVLIINNSINRDVANALVDYSLYVTDEVYNIEYPEPNEHGEEPPEFISNMMKNVDCVLAPTEKSISHTTARKNACKSGTRCATLPGIKKQEFCKGMNTDYEKIRDKCSEVYNIIKNYDEITVKTDTGTDITFEINNKWIIDNGEIYNSGDFSNLPAGEVFTSPTNANGVIYVDGTAGEFGLVGQEPIKFVIEEGKLDYVDNKEIMTRLENSAENIGSEEVFNIAEFAIGCNPNIDNLTGSVLTDEKAIDTIHFAVGNDANIGGSTDVPIHLDYIVKNPKIYADGEQINFDTTAQ